MMTLEQIKKALRDRRLQVVAKETQLHYNTIRAVRDDPDVNPTYKVMVALSNYLQPNKESK